MLEYLSLTLTLLLILLLISLLILSVILSTKYTSLWYPIIKSNTYKINIVIPKLKIGDNSNVGDLLYSFL